MAQPASSSSTPPPHRAASRPVAWIIGAAVLGFAVAFILQQARLGRAQRDADAATTAWHGARLEATLSGAVIEAQAGRFEQARQRTSAFYSGMQRDLLPRIEASERDGARAVLAGRDSIITALARNDPGTAGTLEAILVRLRRTLGTTGIDSLPARAGD